MLYDPVMCCFASSRNLRGLLVKWSIAESNVDTSLKFCSLWSLYFQHPECSAWNYLPWFTIIALSDGRCGAGCSQNLIFFLDLEVPLQIKLKSELPSWGVSAHLVPPLLDKLFHEWQFVAAVPWLRNPKTGVNHSLSLKFYSSSPGRSLLVLYSTRYHKTSCSCVPCWILAFG